jgi:hypothetical protein
MTGLDGLNFEAFDHAAIDLRGRGIEVTSPTEIVSARVSRGRQLGADLRAIIDKVDSVAVLPGWQRSDGARLETFAAWLHGKPIYYYPSWRRVPHRELVRAWLRA